MATANFPLVKTSKYYVFGLNQFVMQDDIDYDNLPIEWLGKFSETKTQIQFDFFINKIKKELDKLEYYDPSERGIIMMKNHYFSFCGIDFEIQINVKIEYGYYEGAAWNFEATLFAPYQYTYYDLPFYRKFSANDMYYDCWHENKGLLKMQENSINRKIDAEYEKLVAELELVFANNCESCLRRIGTFSNGVALYERVA